MRFGRRSKLPLWLAPNLLSLDAPIVAVLWQDLFAACFHVPLTLAGRAALGFAVWAVYIADRLLDSGREDEPRTARHRFHQQHRTLMSVLFLAALAAAVTLALLLARPALIHAGGIVGMCVLLYFFFVHRRVHLKSKFVLAPSVLAPKEIVVALVFTCGTVLAPWTRAADKWSLVGAASALFIACAANTVAIEVFESRRGLGTQDGAPHPATLAVARHFTLVCCFLMAGCGVLWAALPVEARPILAAVGLSGGALWLMVLKQDCLSPDAFRVLADASLLSPIPVWLLWRA